jgi:hypothetical protein
MCLKRKKKTKAKVEKEKNKNVTKSRARSLYFSIQFLRHSISQVYSNDDEKVLLTSQKIVNLSSGRRPLASSSRKSLRINFLNPQSFP